MMRFLNHEIANVHAAALILGAAGLLSRLLGVLRDRLLAAEFGAGRTLDAYYAAFQIPDFISVLFLLGAASAAILPIFQEYLARDRDEARALVARLSSLFVVAAVIISGAAFLAAPFLMGLVAPGFSPAEREIATALSRIMLLSPIFLGLSSILTSVVQSFQRFLAYAAAPILYNLGIIIGIIFFVPRLGVSGLGWGVALGAFLHFAIQYGSARALGFSPFARGVSIYRYVEISSWWRDPGVRKVIALSFPRVLSISLSQLTLIALVAIGSTLSAGSVAVFTLAQNLYYLPVGIFGVSYATAFFPRLARAGAERDAGEFFSSLATGVRSILFWIAPAAALAIVLRAHIVRVALGAGAFSWEDTRLTAASLAVLAIGMFGGGLVTFLIRGFYALGNTWIPLRVNAFFSVFSIGLALFSVSALQPGGFADEFSRSVLRLSGLASPEVIGLAFGFSVGMLLNAATLLWLLRRLAHKILGGLPALGWRAIGGIILASFAAGFAAYAVRASFLESLPLITFAQVLFQGAVAGLAGMLVYFLVHALAGSGEVIAFRDALKRRLLKIGILPKHWDGELHP